MISLKDELSGNSYPGRGIIIGMTPDQAACILAYFIMGRSENSRNRVFVREEDGILTKPYDESKVTDPSLILYAPVRVEGDRMIVTNGDQTDTVVSGLRAGKTFTQALEQRTFEPDAPNYTPRISGMITRKDGKFSYELSLIKSDDGNPDSVERFTFSYSHPVPGEGHFLHTYQHDGNPLPSYCGEPEKIAVMDDEAAFAKMIWDNLNPDNKISLFVRRWEKESGKSHTILINKFGGEIDYE